MTIVATPWKMISTNDFILFMYVWPEVKFCSGLWDCHLWRNLHDVFEGMWKLHNKVLEQLMDQRKCCKLQTDKPETFDGISYHWSSRP